MKARDRGGQMRMFAGGVMLAALAGCAQPQPLCYRAEVLQEVGRVVRTWNVYNAIDPNVVSEAPGERQDRVVCTVSMTSIAYEPTRTGWRPVQSRASRQFDVHVEGNRFVVQVPR